MPETDPSVTPLCVACGSDAVIWGTRMMISGGYRISVFLDTRPSSKLRPHTVMSDGHARVCGDCGYIMLFADDPDTLWNGYIDRLADTLDA